MIPDSHGNKNREYLRAAKFVFEWGAPIDPSHPSEIYLFRVKFYRLDVSYLFGEGGPFSDTSCSFEDAELWNQTARIYNHVHPKLSSQTSADVSLIESILEELKN